MKAIPCLNEINEIQKGINCLERVKDVIKLLYIIAVVVTISAIIVALFYPEWVVAYILSLLYVVIFGYIRFLRYRIRQIKKDFNIKIPREKRMQLRQMVEDWYAKYQSNIERLRKMRNQKAVKISSKYTRAKGIIDQSNYEFSQEKSLH